MTDPDLATDAVLPPEGPVPTGPAADVGLHDAIGGVLASVDEVQDYLDRVVHAVRRHVTGCDEVGITLLIEARPRTAAYSTVATLEVDAIQYQLDEGPCLDAARRRGEFVANLGILDPRWPRFAEAVRDDGVLSVMALPLVSGDECVGALNLYGHERHAFDVFDASLAREAAARAADAILAVIRLDGAQRLAGQLEQAMASRAVIEQAKGVVMALRGIDEHSAFDWLRQTSQHRNVKVRSLAEHVVAGVAGVAGVHVGTAEGSSTDLSRTSTG
jgi:transcriptional regulator with GAF, ATPase, and Fis domain